MSRILCVCAAVASICTLLVWSVGGAEEQKLQFSARRSGTVQGPSVLLRSQVAFVPVRSFAADCSDPARPCNRGGFDHVVGAAGLRNAGFGTLRVRGAPLDAYLVAAYLYVGMIENLQAGGNGSGLPFLTFDGYQVDAKRVARHGEHCWETSSGVNLAAEATLYRADVTSLIHPDINDDYLVAGVGSGTADGSNPFRCPAFLCDPIAPLAQGATVVVVFQHPSVPAASAVYLHEAQSPLPFLTSGLVVGHALVPSAPVNWKELRFTSIGGDGQTRDPEPAFEPVAPLITALDVGGLFGWIRGPGSRVEPNADWTGMDGGTVPQLWDTRTTLVFQQELTPNGAPLVPISTYNVTYEAVADGTFSYDCVNPSAHVLSVYAWP